MEQPPFETEFRGHKFIIRTLIIIVLIFYYNNRSVGLNGGNKSQTNGLGNYNLILQHKSLRQSFLKQRLQIEQILQKSG